MILKEKLENQNRFLPITYRAGVRFIILPCGGWTLPMTVGQRLARIKSLHDKWGDVAVIKNRGTYLQITVGRDGLEV